MSGELIRNEDLVWRDEPERREEIEEALERGEDAFEAGWVILVDQGEMHQLNLLAGDIWMLCDGTRDEGAIVSTLHELYDAPMEVIGADVAGFVGDCLEKGWLLRKD